MDHNKLLNEAKFNLIYSRAALTVFYAAILFSMKTVWEEKIPTAGVDGKHLFINPAFFAGLTLDGVLFLLAHESLHIAYRHIDGFVMYSLREFPEAVERKLWNMAGDYAINLALVKAGYTMIQGGLLDHAYEGMTTVEIYRILHKKHKTCPISFDDFDGDVMVPDTGTAQADREFGQLKRHIDKVVIKASIMTQQTAKGKDWGNIPGEILRLLGEAMNPKLDFMTILANHMTRYAKSDYSFRRPNRRYWPHYYLPSAYSEQLCDLALIFDVSGSVDDPTASSYKQAVTMIKSLLNPEKILLLQFDTYLIGKPQEITQSIDIAKLKWRGGGGTDISPVLKWVNTNKPEVTLIFTDGEFEPDNRKLDADVIWIVHNNPNFRTKHGQIVHHEI